MTRRFPAASRNVTLRIYAHLLVSLVSDHKRMLRRFAARPGHGLSRWIGLVAIHSSYEYLRGLSTFS